jgi:uncharacterized protein YlxW (UPF0749 family)
MEDEDMTRGARFRIGLAIAMSLSGVAMRATADPHRHGYRVRNHAAEELEHRRKLREERERKAKEAEAQKGQAAEAHGPVAPLADR